MEREKVFLLKDKFGIEVNYMDLIKLNEQVFVLSENSEIHMIEMMKFQGYLHLLESELELILPFEQAIQNFPELYI